MLLESLTIIENQIKKTKQFLVEGATSPTLADLGVFEEASKANAQLMHTHHHY